MSSASGSKLAAETRSKKSSDVARLSNDQSTWTDPNSAILDLQRTVGNQSVNPMVNSLGGGTPLPRDLRSEMEQRFGNDFRSVRTYTDPRAAESADGLNAKAYTIGNNIVFNKGRFTPETADGKRLLAHELAHVVQQSRGGTNPMLDAHAPHESAADAAAMQAMTGSGPVTVSGATGVGVACQTDEDSLDPRWSNPGGSVNVDVQVVDVAPQTAAKLRSVLENEYVPSDKQAKQILKRNPDYDFSAKAARDRGNAYEKVIREGIEKGDISHPLLDQERGIPRAKMSPEYGDPFERELTRGRRAQGRIQDIGWAVEVTVEGVNTGSLSGNKLAQLGRDLRNNGQATLVVPELTPEMHRQLGELATRAQSSLGGERRIQVLIVNGMPAESKLVVPKPVPSIPHAPVNPAKPQISAVKPSEGPPKPMASPAPPSSIKTTQPQAIQSPVPSGSESGISKFKSRPTSATLGKSSNALENLEATKNKFAPQQPIASGSRGLIQGKKTSEIANAEVRQRRLESKLMSIAKIAGVIIQIGGEIINLGSLLSDALEIKSMLNRGLLSKGKVFTAYQETALKMADNANLLAENQKAFQVQLVNLQPDLFASFTDQWLVGLVSMRIEGWLDESIRLRTEVDETIKNIDVAIELIPKQKELAIRITNDSSLGMTYVLGNSGSSLSLANLMFFIVEADDIRWALSRASKSFHGALETLLVNIESLQSWKQFLGGRE